MAELLKSGAVLIHVPKTGGTWVREVLRKLNLLYRDSRMGLKHSTPEHINDILRFRCGHFIRHWPFRPTVTPKKLRDAFKFCFVRNPLRWYESWWKYMAGHWHPWEADRWHPQRMIDNCGDDDFNVFLANILRNRPGYVSEMYSWYTEGVDFVGKCESLADDLVRALDAAGLNVDIEVLHRFPSVNQSKSHLGEPEWDSMILQKIIDSESASIERFGYWDEVVEFGLAKGVMITRP